MRGAAALRDRRGRGRAPRAEQTHERLVEHATTDWREVLAHPEVEAVSMTAPNFMHREVAVAAAEAGKHFWGDIYLPLATGDEASRRSS